MLSFTQSRLASRLGLVFQPNLFTLQSLSIDDPYIKREAIAVAPATLEHYMIKYSDKFQAMGSLTIQGGKFGPLTKELSH